jgi:predicted CXXCH cytochrome family protein
MLFQRRETMFRKTVGIAVTSVAAFLVLFLSFWTFAEQASKEPPEEMMLDNTCYKSDLKGPVPFSHLNHSEDYDIACNQCHHVYENGENVWREGDPVDKCSSCHSPLESKGEVKKLKLAFHKSCKGCHKRMVKEGIAEDAPYRRCNDCHQKKS